MVLRWNAKSQEKLLWLSEEFLGTFDSLPERQPLALGACKELPAGSPWQNWAAGKEAGTHRAGRAGVDGIEAASLSPVI